MWEVTGDYMAGLLDSCGSQWPPAWSELHGETLRARVLSDEERLAPAIDGMIRTALATGEWPPMSSESRWLLAFRTRFALRFCREQQAADAPPAQLSATELLERLLIDAWYQFERGPIREHWTHGRFEDALGDPAGN